MDLKAQFPKIWKFHFLKYKKSTFFWENINFFRVDLFHFSRLRLPAAKVASYYTTYTKNAKLNVAILCTYVLFFTLYNFFTLFSLNIIVDTILITLHLEHVSISKYFPGSPEHFRKIHLNFLSLSWTSLSWTSLYHKQKFRSRCSYFVPILNYLLHVL